MKRAAVFTHHHPADTEVALTALREAAPEHGFELLFSAEETARHDFTDGPGIVTNVDFAAIQPDIAIVFGGDGSVLHALREFAGSDVPTFGFNFGAIGFLTTVEPSELEPGLKLALTGEFEVLKLPGLRLRYGEIDLVGINDVAFDRPRDARVSELSYSLAGEQVGRVRCDGLVAATPAGSTGYNLANNGPILAWGVEGYVISFIAPHTLTARALVAAPGDLLEVTNVSRRDSLEILIDGRAVGLLPVGEVATVSFEDDVASLAQLPGSSFYRRFREKFGRLAS